MSEPILSLPGLTVDYPPSEFPSFVNQFRLLINANNWNSETASCSLHLVLADELRIKITHITEINEGFELIFKHFFPATDFFL